MGKVLRKIEEVPNQRLADHQHLEGLEITLELTLWTPPTCLTLLSHFQLHPDHQYQALQLEDHHQLLHQPLCWPLLLELVEQLIEITSLMVDLDLYLSQKLI